MSSFAFRKVQLASAPCSSGKTHAACEYINEHIGDSNHLFVAPTLQLLTEVAKTLTGSFGIKPKVITSDTERRALAGIVNYLKDAPYCGEVLLITHQSYFRIPYFPRRENWEIYIDEIPQVDSFHCPRLPRSPHLLSQHLEVKRNVNEQISLLGAIDETDLKHYLEKPKDDGEACVRDILANVLNPYCNVFVWTDDWDRSIENKHVEDCSDRNRVRMITLRNSQGFYGATVLGANIEKSMLHHWLKRRGVEMTPHVALMQHLRYQEYPAHLGERLTIDYVLSGNKHFSKARRDRIVKSGRKLSDEIDDAVMKEVGASNFLLVVNGDYKGKLLEAPGSRQISVASQGLNAYSNYTTLVFLAALNRSPDHMRMLNALGFDAEVMRQSTVYEHLHQCVMRTNLREPASSSKVQIIVPDRASADFLVGLFGKARVRHLGTASYEERQTYTKTERNRRSEFKQASTLWRGERDPRGRGFAGYGATIWMRTARQSG